MPGFEIPSRYFNYLRTGDLAPLAAVFEHNRLDLLSLAALTAIAARMAGEGPAGAPSPHEALAMGQIYVRLGRWDEADACFARAAGLGDAPWDARSIDRGIRADALRHLALERRRQHRYEEAAEAWRQLLEAGAGPRLHAGGAARPRHPPRAPGARPRGGPASCRACPGIRAGSGRSRRAFRHRLERLNRKLGG